MSTETFKPRLFRTGIWGDRLEVDDMVRTLTGRPGVVVHVDAEFITVRWDSDDEFQYRFARPVRFLTKVFP